MDSGTYIFTRRHLITGLVFLILSSTGYFWGGGIGHSSVTIFKLGVFNDMIEIFYQL